jgi:hypothetical protein
VIFYDKLRSIFAKDVLDEERMFVYYQFTSPLHYDECLASITLLFGDRANQVGDFQIV